MRTNSTSTPNASGRTPTRPSTLLALLSFILLLAITACDESEPEPLPRHMLMLVQSDGRVLGRHAEDIEAIDRAIEFPIAPAPDALSSYPLILVEGVVNPPQSHVRYWYGPPETLDSDTLEQAKFILAQYGNPSSPRFDGGEPIEVAGQPAWLSTSSNSIFVRWEACASTFTLTGWQATAADTIAAAEAIGRTCDR